jgi:hypothetical protein
MSNSSLTRLLRKLIPSKRRRLSPRLPRISRQQIRSRPRSYHKRLQNTEVLNSNLNGLMRKISIFCRDRALDLALMVTTAPARKLLICGKSKLIPLVENLNLLSEVGKESSRKSNNRLFRHTKDRLLKRLKK